ncbi:MAG: LysR family transcriptional regulator [Pseudonocardia sp.]|nr:LysR family transcriptional regulator [Pseudonocardia sp.]MBO0871806.1 LysR family transcriptional regulator [Pseudonocardia sp.]
MSDVDLRLLRYFVAVAEERNFTRAAERLMMTQPALSRAVRALEATVGVPLLVRRYRDVEPTHAGRVLLEQARWIDERASAAIQLVRQAPAATTRLRVTAPACEVSLLDGLVSSYNRTRPDVPATAVVVEPKDLADELRNGGADASLIRPPFDERGLDSEELLAEPWLVVLPERHPLAALSELRLAQLAGLPVIRWRERRADGYLMWPFDAPAPDRWIPGPAVSDSSEIPALARLGQGIAIFPTSFARNASAAASAGLRVLRVVDCPPATVRITWPKWNTSPAIAALVRHATVSTSEILGRKAGAQ